MTATEQPSLAMSFELIRSRFHDPDFLHCRGLGGEVPVYVYPYDAAKEDEVRALTASMLEDNRKELEREPDTAARIINFDLWDVFEAMCESRGILEKISKLDARLKDRERLLKKIQSSNPPKRYLDFMSAQYEERYGEPQRGRDVVLITGVGKIYPFVRAHSILEGVQSTFSGIPVVMFYPGGYDGKQLKLFNTVADGNYYRAFNQL